jgi:MFS superfamily sulfate permease-like transporter
MSWEGPVRSFGYILAAFMALLGVAYAYQAQEPQILFLVAFAVAVILAVAHLPRLARWITRRSL